MTPVLPLLPRVLILVFLGLLLLAALLVVRLIRNPKIGSRVFRVALVVAVAVVLFGLVASVLIPVRSSGSLEPDETAMPAGGSSAAAWWSPDLDRRFEADFYPCGEDAAAALGHALAEVLATAAPASPVVVRDDEGGILVTAAQKEALAAALRLADPSRSVRVVDSHAAVAGAIDIMLRTIGIDRHYEMTASLDGPTGDLSFQVSRRFVDKPWVSHFDTFINAEPSGRFLVVTSGGTATDPSVAHQEALQRAAAQLNGHLMGTGQPVPGLLPLSAVENLVRDRFVQRLRTTHSEIWREALLLDVAPDRVASLLISRPVRRMQMRRYGPVTGLAALIVVLGCLYFFLDRATRGYYRQTLIVTWTLMVVAAMVAAGLLWA